MHGSFGTTHTPNTITSGIQGDDTAIDKIGTSWNSIIKQLPREGDDF
jgi:hypothetical protein